MATRTRSGSKLTKPSVKAVATALVTSSVSSDTNDLTESVLEKVGKLPELDLYLERKKFFKRSAGESFATLYQTSVRNILYTLYGSCHGKNLMAI